ncbi:hypothetical protein, partial [Vibrio nigripulchritudo]|uniref:hypothetical protein n=1 Tax=Vibrio nigripulchritudo TaxID=28173 RepID=UPI001F3C85C5
ISLRSVNLSQDGTRYENEEGWQGASPFCFLALFLGVLKDHSKFLMMLNGIDWSHNPLGYL